MTALPPDVVADLSRLVAELEQRLEQSFAAHDEAIAQKAAAARENALLRDELASAREREAASAEILRTISGVSGDADQSLPQIAGITARLFGASSVRIRLVEDGEWGSTFHVGRSSEAITSIVPDAKARIGGRNLPGTVVAENRQIHIPDLDNIDREMADWPGLPPARAAGARTVSGTPLRRDGKAIGVLLIHRDHLQPFSDAELAVQQNFADQAAIAVENSRLFGETREALEQQRAVAAILSAINNAGGNLGPVFDCILENAHHLCDAPCGSLQLYEGDRVVPVAIRGMTAPFAEFLRDGYPVTEGIRNGLLASEPLQRADMAEFIQTIPDEPSLRAAVELGGIRTMVTVPLAKDGVTFGRIVAGRREVRPFEHKQVALLQSFAAQAVIAIENARLFNETREALERQTATADILKVIASSPADVQPVFDAIVNSAAKLFDPCSATITTLKEGKLHWNATAQIVPSFDHAAARAVYPIPFDPDHSPSARAVLERRIIVIPDTNAPGTPEYTRKVAAAGGFRNIMFVPLIHENKGIGTIILTHPQPGFRLSDKQLALVQTFADQAVIAIENARLFDEVKARTDDLSEALQQQTATADVLKVISRSVFDLQTVLDTLVESAYKLCGANLGLLYLRVDEAFECKATAGMGVAQANLLFKGRPIRAGRGTAAERVIMTGEVQSITDFFEDPEFDPKVREAIRNATESDSNLGQLRSTLAVPMTRDNAVVGVIVIARSQVGPFPQRQIELLQTFADQAVIAIENVRLFDEVQARTEDLRESLQQQTATADVLKVISRSAFDLQTVLETLITSAVELSGANRGSIFLREGDVFPLKAASSTTPEFLQYWAANPPRSGRGSATSRVIASGKVEAIPDVLEDREMQMTAGSLVRIRAALGVPMLRDNKVEGVLVLTRPEPGPFTKSQIDLVQTFADQAVIAVENVRLFDEVQARTEDLRESLQQQTATADVLKVISRSAFDLQTVLDTLTESAARLCDADEGTIFQPKDGAYRLASSCGLSTKHKEFLGNYLFKPGNETTVGRVLLQGKAIHIDDFQTDSNFAIAGDDSPARTRLGVPLLREGAPIGVFVLTRREMRPFNSNQIELVQTFADQAVIAIENVRLFDEVQAKTADLTEALTYQTGSGNILRVIASSPTDVEPVLNAIVESACELCEAEDAIVFLLDDGDLRSAAHRGPIPEGLTRLPISRTRIVGRAFLDRKPVHMRDFHSVEGAEFPDGQAIALRLGHRTMLAVPLLREGESIGIITLRRNEVHPFSDKQIALLQTFADQAVIAIGNVRLFEQVQARTRELAASLDELRTAQDRLVQTEKLASLGQLTAGIAHEIKNPLNFVNNFAALSAELTDELNDVLKPATISDKIREEVDELTGLLKDNLAKVVQHGKRADSIVKNMLLHSREGSGDHRPADINALVDESLNLAYHGARAEKPQFNVTLQRNFDPNAGMIEMFPQEITRVFLNLIANGFYAVNKRKTENNEDFDPVVSATTTDRGSHVEIRIRDNGTGIPDEVKEKMFNPFFTTKPAGEGTGLGLSMSHDIIVKQHGGTIDVATEPGQFTEFTVVLPRASNLSSKT